MTTRPHHTGRFATRLGFVSATVAPLIIAACSSDSSGLRAGDGAATAVDGQGTDSVGRLTEAGGTATPIDVGRPGPDLPTLVGTGGRGTLDAGGTGGQGGRGDGAVDAGIDASAAGQGGTGGGGRVDAQGQGDRSAGSGGAMAGDGATRPDAVTDVVDAPALDLPASPPDSPADAALARSDVTLDRAADRADTRSIDEATDCGDLDMPCCDQRTCNAADLVCTGGGGTARGTCVACGGEGEACCAGDTCTAPGTSCSGGGRGGGGTCR